MHYDWGLRAVKVRVMLGGVLLRPGVLFFCVLYFLPFPSWHRSVVRSLRSNSEAESPQKEHQVWHLLHVCTKLSYAWCFSKLVLAFTAIVRAGGCGSV